MMRIEICPTADDANAIAASLIANALAQAVADRGLGVAALSGGSTPEGMLAKLAATDLPWPEVHLVQVDERIVGPADERRNLISIQAAFADSPLPHQNLHGMPVDHIPLEAGAASYAEELETIAGRPAQVDVVHLGLGEDGHTASLVPGDAALESGNDVAVTGAYKETRRMTLTLHALDRARCRVWLVTGRSKRNVVRRFLARDTSLVASRVNSDATIVVLDEDAAGK